MIAFYFRQFLEVYEVGNVAGPAALDDPPELKIILDDLPPERKATLALNALERFASKRRPVF